MTQTRLDMTQYELSDLLSNVLSVSSFAGDGGKRSSESFTDTVYYLEIYHI